MAKKRGSPLQLRGPGDLLDVGVYNPSRYFSVCPADDSGGQGAPYADWSDLKAVQQIVARGELLYAQLCEDNDFIVRFRLGDASPQEDEEWVCRIVGKLSLPRGKLWCNRVVVDVPPGDYLADLRCYLPNATATYALEWVVDSKLRNVEALLKYWKQTRRGQPTPVWLMQAQVNEADDAAEVERWEEELGDRTDEKHVEFLVRLGPLPARVVEPGVAAHSFYGEALPRGFPKPDVDAPCCCVWECRKPSACPQGIVADRVLNPGI